MKAAILAENSCRSPLSQCVYAPYCFPLPHSPSRLSPRCGPLEGSIHFLPMRPHHHALRFSPPAMAPMYPVSLCRRGPPTALSKSSTSRCVKTRKRMNRGPMRGRRRRRSASHNRPTCPILTAKPGAARYTPIRSALTPQALRSPCRGCFTTPARAQPTLKTRGNCSAPPPRRSTPRYKTSSFPRCRPTTTHRPHAPP